MKRLIMIFGLFVLTVSCAFAQVPKSEDDILPKVYQHRYRGKNMDQHVFGHVVSNREHLPFVSVIVKGTTVGTATDETGHYRLMNLPEGTLIIKGQSLGYQ